MWGDIVHAADNIIGMILQVDAEMRFPEINYTPIWSVKWTRKCEQKKKYARPYKVPKDYFTNFKPRYRYLITPQKVLSVLLSV